MEGDVGGQDEGEQDARGAVAFWTLFPLLTSSFSTALTVADWWIERTEQGQGWRF